MDPVGPWSYTYNRLAAGAAAGATSGDFHHHLATAAANNAASVGAPATTSQLLAQAAHTTSLGSSATSAYPGGFLSPPTVGYDAVFTPFLHHPNPKPAHYSSTINAQHRQALAQDAAPAAAHHQPQSSAFFEQASSGGAASGSATATTWQGGGNQLPSPFGILPHENVPSSGGGSKSATAPANPAASVYDNFNAHIAAQSLYHINSQLAANAAVAAANKVAAAAAAVRSASPQVTASTAAPPANKITTATNFYQTPGGYAERSSYASVISQKQQQQQPTSNSDYSTNTGGSKSSSSANSNNIGQSCVIVSASPVSPSKDYRILATIPTSSAPSSPSTHSTHNTSNPPKKARQYMQPLKVQQMTKAQSKVYPETNGERLEAPPQSSPISYTVPDVANRGGYTTGVGKSSPVNNNNHRHSSSPMQTFQQVTPPYRHFQPPKVTSDVEVSFTRVAKSGTESPGGGETSKTSPQMTHVASPVAYPMYNSPMNSMSSPQQTSEQHYPPRSPLDVTISRANAIQNPVAYSSVITRAVADATRYAQERSPQQNCWDNRQSATQRGYGQPAEQSGITILQDLSNCRGDPMSIVRALQEPPAEETKQPPVAKRRPGGRKVTVSDKSGDSDKETTSEEYFESRVPPPAHEAATARPNGGGGQQNGGYIDFERWNLPPPPPKISSGGGAFAQASFGQSAQSIMVPPLPYFPAFHLATSAGGHHTTASAADFGGGPEYTGGDVYPSATDPSSSSNDVSNNLGSCNSHDVRDDEPPKVVVPNIEEELGFLAERSGAPGCQQQQQQQIVANAMQTTMTSSAGGHQEEQNIAKSIAEKKYNLPKGVGSGFMGSYLKFLQGERDTSPPPASRGGRKATWSRTAASTGATTTTTTTTSKSQSSYNAQQQQISNGVNIHSQQIIQPPPQQVASDQPPDERYYQTSARNNSKRKYDDDDERTRKGVKADKVGADNSGKDGKKTRGLQQQQATPHQTLQTLQPTPVVQATAPPHLPLHPHPHHHHPQPPPQMMQQSYYQQPDEVPQRREMSHRKAKGRSVLQLLNMSLNNEDFAGAASDDEPAEFQDSDTDPVWTPEVDDDDEEWEQGRRKLKKTRDVRNKSRKMSQGEEEPQMRDFLPMKDNVQEEVVSLDMEQQMPKESVIQMQEKSNGQKAQVPDTQGNQEGFKIGQFIVNIQDEITHEWPKLWRVDGKNLLEKYEPILKAGKIVYRNESVFAALLPESYGNYKLVKVNSLHTPTDFRNRQSSLMEWVREGTQSSPVKEQSTSHQSVIRENPAQNVTPLVDLGPEVLATPILTPFERLMQEKLVYQEHFEIYIQTLISQALDPNFLTEIIQENDEYFLGSVRAIDSLVEGLRTRLLTARPISRNFHTALEMWPQYEVMQLGENYPPQMACTSCLRAVASVHIRFSGQFYNSVTMTARDFQTGVTYERDFTLCGQCEGNLRMHHRMKHQKYTLYMACTQKVQERSGQDPTKTSTTILNELLAEDSWLEELFKNVRQSWVELELLVDPQGTPRY
uniref:Putative mucin-19 n=1 Tax=Phlebotomus kandelakii TaxID=1109342 RepID=A0A6B2EBY5_9DIPT